jgi:hypothetical protein
MPDFVPYQVPIKPSHHDESAARLPCGRVDAVGHAHSEISDLDVPNNVPFPHRRGAQLLQPFVGQLFPHP